ncbi:MAG: PHP domain-containing protein [Candidatus Zixiibacteriota bacterium]
MGLNIDLHIHTTHSDGTCSGAKVLEIVRELSLGAFAVTDHDTVEGYFEIQKLRKNKDPEIIPGVELSVKVNDDDLHILGYLFDPHDRKVAFALEDFQKKRKQRGRLIVQRLNDLGLSLTFEAVEEIAGRAVIGRPHIAEALARHGQVGSYQEAFDHYIKNGGPAYVPKEVMNPAEAISLLHQAGGLAVLAHPYIGDMLRYLDMLTALGLDGLEVYHYSHNRENIAFLKSLVERYGLLATGGSDFHGRSGQNGRIGSPEVPYEYLEELKNKIKLRRGRN